MRNGWQLHAILYPFVWGATSINLFLLSLGWQSLGYSVLSPVAAMLIALAVALPLNYLCVRWARSLIQQAEQ